MRKIACCFGVVVFVLINSCSPKGANLENIDLPDPVLREFTFNVQGGNDGGSELLDRSISQRNTVIINDNLVVIGGFFQSNNLLKDKNDLIWTNNGTTWRKAVDGFISPERTGYSVGLYRNKIIIAGGQDRPDTGVFKSIFRNDLVMLPLQNISKAVVLRKIPNKSFSAVIEFKNDLFIIGGVEKSQPSNSVIRINEDQVASVSRIPEIDGLANIQAWISADTLFITDLHGTFWKSDNGTDWQKLVIEKAFTARGGYVVIPRGNDWFLMAGLAGGASGLYEDQAGLCNDVWKSTDQGKNWELISTGLNDSNPGSAGAGAWGYYKSYPARQDCVGLLFQGKLLIGGGRDENGYRHDFWTSSDGIIWKELK